MPTVASDRLRLCIVLPTLNERANIAPLIARIEGALGEAGWEALVVDDDSPDGTAAEARALALADRRVRVIHRIGRRGLASAAIEGMCATPAPFVAVMDADHQHDPALLPAMLAALEADEADICVASRFVESVDQAGWADPERKRLSRLANAITRGLARVQLTDPMSGYFMVPSATGRALVPRMSGIGFKVLLDLLAASREPMRVHEFPLRFAPRRAGTSKLDRAILFDFLAGFYHSTLGRVVPTRFALFGTVGAIGVLVHYAVLATLYPGMTATFWKAQTLAVLVAMSFNFWLDNWLTYRDRRLIGISRWLGGWARFCATCALGGGANVAVATLMEGVGVWWPLAALVGILIGSVWNYALSSQFVWGRYG